MTPYRFDNQQKKASVSRTRMVTSALVLAVVGGLAIFGIASLLKTVTRGPAWLARTAEDGVVMAITRLTPKNIIIAKNKNLEEQIASYQAALIELDQVKQENQLLRSELSYNPTERSSITAQIIGKPNHSLFNSMVIDAGTDQGVEVGQLVVAYGTIGVGQVAAVSSTTATVELFGAPAFEGEVLLSTKGIMVPAKGKGTGNFEIHIPREVEVSDGDLLAFPQNPSVTIGVVKSIIFDPRDPFQTVLARLPVNVQELRFVRVLQ